MPAALRLPAHLAGFGTLQRQIVRARLGNKTGLYVLKNLCNDVFGPVAQWLEPAAHNGLVASSNLAGPTIFYLTARRCASDGAP
jgi:hypothetical protein